MLERDEARLKRYKLLRSNLSFYQAALKAAGFEGKLTITGFEQKCIQTTTMFNRTQCVGCYSQSDFLTQRITQQINFAQVW